MTTKQKQQARAAAARAAHAAQQREAELTAFRELFVAEYVANGGNATRAYLSASGNGVKVTTAGVEACRLLKDPRVRAAVDAGIADRFKRLEMKGDEAIALLSLTARANLAQAYDEEGKQLPFWQWPETLQLAVKGIKPDGTVILQDPLKARELMAVATGRLRATVDVHHFDHAKYLAGLDEPPDGGPDGEARKPQADR